MNGNLKPPYIPDGALGINGSPITEGPKGKTTEEKIQYPQNYLYTLPVYPFIAVDCERWRKDLNAVLREIRNRKVGTAGALPAGSPLRDRMTGGEDEFLGRFWVESIYGPNWANIVGAIHDRLDNDEYWYKYRVDWWCGPQFVKWRQDFINWNNALEGAVEVAVT